MKKYKSMLKSVWRQLTDKEEVSFPDGNYYYTEHTYSATAIKTAIERVNAGMASLDERVPDWLDKIEIGRLRMANGSFCILGQTFGSFDRKGVAFVSGLVDDMDVFQELTNMCSNHRFPIAAKAALEEYEKLTDVLMKSEIELGFMEDSTVDFPLLDVAWVSALRIRAQAKGKPVFLAVPA